LEKKMKAVHRPKVAEFITRMIKERDISQSEIAKACSWPKANMVTMIKQGKSKLPIDKIGPLARILRVEPVYLFWLTLQEYMPETLTAIEFSLRGVMLTGHERDIIDTYRDLTHGIDQDVELHVGGDEAVVKTSGSKILYREVPGKSTKIGLAAPGVSH
jgi:transcriptional regulator with XRE-family HTH domain